MKVGLDDFFAAGKTVEQLLALSSAELRPPPKSEDESDESKIYFIENGCTYWSKETKEGPVPVCLANFSAQIVEDVIEDDGAETRRIYRIRAVVRGRPQEIKVLSERFTLMNWPAELLGPGAIVSAGMGSKDRFREATQTLSAKEIPHRRVYLHLGWIDHDGKPVYLHAGGAIGADGVVEGIDVRLDSPLDRYVLPAPPIGDALRDAVRQSLALLDGLASDKVMFPMFSFLWTTVLRALEEALHLTGKTGERKTELLALIQRHHGASMDAHHLPLSWSSTGNMIEGTAFLAKDSTLGVDDFSPAGSAMDVQRQNREADRVFRGRGNAQGRGRLRPDGTPRPPKPPRAGIFSTGEDIPHGHSMRARMIVLRVAAGEVNLDRLTERQGAGEFYPKAMAGYVQWIARHRPEVLRWFNTEVPNVRRELLPHTPHGRTATAGAQLILGHRIFLLFAKECGAIDDAQMQDLDRRARSAILAVLADQAEHQAASDPAQLFVQLVAAALLAGDAHLADRSTGGVPEKDDLARAVGWQHSESSDGQGTSGDWHQRGSQIGWVDPEEDLILLLPTPAYRAAQKQADASPARIGVGEKALWDRLHEAGVLVSEDHDRHTKKTRVCGRAHNLLHLRLSLVLGESGTSGTDTTDGPDGGGDGGVFPMSVPDLSVGGTGSGTENGNAAVAPESPAQGNGIVPDVPDAQDNKDGVAQRSRGEVSRDRPGDPTGNVGSFEGRPEGSGTQPTQGAFFDEAPAFHDDGSEMSGRG